jgi:hypothetical protein
MSKFGYFFLLLILTFLVYINSIRGEFVWVDHGQIEDGRLIIKSWQEFKNVFFTPLVSKEKIGNYYRPLFKTSLSLDYLFWKLKPQGYHLTNIFLHFLTNFIFFLICIKLLIPKRISFLLTAINVVHPLHVSNVAWISGRSDLLVSFFILLSFYFYIKRDNIFSYILSLFTFFLALLSKEIAVVFPLFILFFEIIYYEKRKVNPIRKDISNGIRQKGIFYPDITLRHFSNGVKKVLPYFLISSAYLILRFIVLGRIGTRIGLFWGMPYVTILSSLVGFCKYLFKIFIPIKLSVSDAFPQYYSLFSTFVFSSVFVIIFILFLFYKNFVKKDKLGFLAISWLFIFYIPISNIIPALHFWAERFFYLPIFGILLYFANYLKKSNIGYLGFVCLVGLIIFFSLESINYSHKFKDDETLFNYTLEVEPHSLEAYSMLGFNYLRKGNYRLAIYYYILSLNSDKGYYQYRSDFEACNNIGVILMRLKQYKEAKKWFERAEEINPNDKLLKLNLKILNDKMSKLNEK